MAQTAEALKLDAQVREQRGKEKAKKIRQAGKLPGIVYGTKKAPMSVIIDAHEFQLVRQATHGDQILIDLAVENGEHDKVFIKDLQRDPVTDKIKHVDFLRVDMAQEITLDISVHQVGDVPVGVREGGLLEQIRHKVGVRCLPGNVPAHIDVDLSGLGMGEALHVSQLPQIEGVEYLDEPEITIFSIVSKAKLDAAAAAQQAADDAAAEAAQPAEGEKATEAPEAEGKE